MTDIDIEDIVTGYIHRDFEKTMNQKSKIAIRSSLLSWYHNNRRLLPWRGDNTKIPITAYSVWVSEVMLQQTRVETVIDYWNRWMETYPTVQSLAVATPDEVNRLWAGLGYYRRAQQLLKGAKMVCDELDGVIPQKASELLKIPGIGPYTAGAISSIAFGEVEPVVDGNVIRVLSRVFAIDYEVSSSLMSKHCWSIAKTLVDEDKPADFNQAIMELGATLCKPTSPDCESCPLRTECRTKALVGLSEDRKKEIQSMTEARVFPYDVTFFPVRGQKKQPKEIDVSVCILRVNVKTNCVKANKEKGEVKYLLVRRPSKGLLANQWEFPSLIIREEENKEIKDEELGVLNSEKMALSEKELFEQFPDFFEKLKLSFECNEGVKEEVIDLIDDIEKSQKFKKTTNNLLCEIKSTHTKFDPILHVFSHQRHTMYLRVLDLFISYNEWEVICNEAWENEFSCRWMTSAEILEVGITTGCKKVLNAVLKWESTQVISEGGTDKNAFQRMKRASTIQSKNKIKAKKVKKSK